VAEEFEKAYPSLNLYLDRGDTEYETHGRFQTKDEAVEIDETIKELLSSGGNTYYVLGCRDLDQIMSVVSESIDIR